MRALGLGRVSSFYAAMLLLALAAAWLREDLGTWLPRAPLDWLWRVAIGLGVGLGIVGVTRGAVALFGWAETLVQEFRSMIGELSVRQALAMALASGIGEEALFRGVLQPLLGLWLGAAVFGMLHIGPTRRFLPWTAMAFAAGLLFGVIVLWTGDLVAAVVAHVTVNFVNLRFLGAPDAHQGIDLGPVGGELGAR